MISGKAEDAHFRKQGISFRRGLGGRGGGGWLGWGTDLPLIHVVEDCSAFGLQVLTVIFKIISTILLDSKTSCVLLLRIIMSKTPILTPWTICPD